MKYIYYEYCLVFTNQKCNYDISKQKHFPSALILDKLFMYNKNNTGPSALPCITPYSTNNGSILSRDRNILLPIREITFYQDFSLNSNHFLIYIIVSTE